MPSVPLGDFGDAGKKTLGPLQQKDEEQWDKCLGRDGGEEQKAWIRYDSG